MACNLAIAITKAVLTDERLTTLLNDHMEQVQHIMEVYLQRQHPDIRVTSGSPETGRVYLDTATLFLEGGKVTVTESRGVQQLAQRVNEEASAFLPLVADQLFTQEVERTLKRVAHLTGKQTSDVEDAGAVKRATVYSLDLNGLKARVFVLPGARMQVFIDSGTFSQAKAATEQLLQAVKAQGLGLQQTSEVEQHRSDVDHVHVRQAVPRGGH